MTEHPVDIINAAKSALDNILPDKSRGRYDEKYKMFCEWRLQKHVTGLDETILMAFLHEKVM